MSRAMIKAPDTAIAQFPGGGTRTLATALKLQFFEEFTHRPSHEIFPHVIADSAGFLIAACLYLPEGGKPDHPVMKARTLCEMFFDIAQALPKRPALIANPNSNDELAKELRILFGDATLRDFRGSVYTSAHMIGKGADSFTPYAKLMTAKSDDVRFIGDPDHTVLDIALATTALPTVLIPHNNQMDLGFSKNISIPLLQIKEHIGPEHECLFVSIPNYRFTALHHEKIFHETGILPQALSFSFITAVSDHIISQNLYFARALLGEHAVFHLDQEIGNLPFNEMPSASAIARTRRHFELIRSHTERHITENLATYEKLGSLLLSTIKQREQTRELA